MSEYYDVHEYCTYSYEKGFGVSIIPEGTYTYDRGETIHVGLPPRPVPIVYLRNVKTDYEYRPPLDHFRKWIDQKVISVVKEETVTE